MAADRVYFTVEEIRLQLRLAKPDPVLTAIRAGQLAAVNVSSGPKRPTWRISSAALAAWLESRTVKPPAGVAKRTRKKTTSAITTYF